MKVLTVVGARPQFVKAAAVSQALGSAGIQECLVHTGQHYDHAMSQVFFDELGMQPPARNLGVGSASHGAQTAAMLSGIEQAILEEKPDWVLTYGDTNSTLAGALAAVKLHVPTAHVEAGLRSYNRRMPEEINRVATDAISDLLLAPTEAAEHTLLQEGIPQSCIRMVGDVMADTARIFGDKAQQRSLILRDLDLTPGKYALATVHRAENTDDPERLRTIVSDLVGFTSDMPVVLPLHPRTRAALARENMLERAERTLRIIQPAGYLDMLMLERHAALIITDSGGVQKEAYFFRVPCVTMRTETEWVELVATGWNRLAPPERPGSVLEAARHALGTRGAESQLYGDGHASERIAAALSSAVPR
jgi:UDP-GlcNAc3NAcA epimerase